jgi:hypothetical protein
MKLHPTLSAEPMTWGSGVICLKSDRKASPTKGNLSWRERWEIQASCLRKAGERRKAPNTEWGD